MTPGEWVAQNWAACRDRLKAALDASVVHTHDIDHVLQELIKGTAQLWPTRGAAVVTEVSQYPTGIRGLTYWLAGGELEDVLRTHAAVERFAREQGCSFIEIRGRRGWRKAVEAYGFRPVGTYYVKELSNGKQKPDPDYH